MRRIIVTASLATLICAGLLFAAGGHKYSGKFQWDYQVTTGVTADSITVDSLQIFRFDNLYDKGKISGVMTYRVVSTDTTAAGTPIDTTECYWRVSAYTAFASEPSRAYKVWSHWMDSASAQRDTVHWFTIDTVLGDFIYFEVDGACFDSTFAGVVDSSATFEIGVDMKATQ